MAAGAPGPSNLGAGAQAPGIGPMSVGKYNRLQRLMNIDTDNGVPVPRIVQSNQIQPNALQSNLIPSMRSTSSSYLDGEQQQQ